jgi:hypothetical protein
MKKHGTHWKPAILYKRTEEYTGKNQPVYAAVTLLRQALAQKARLESNLRELFAKRRTDKIDISWEVTWLSGELRAIKRQIVQLQAQA